MKIFGIGLNYVDHVYEFGRKELPTTPVVFSKPETALLKGNSPFYYPSFSNNIHFEVELVIKIGKEGKSIAEKFALNYVEAIGLGIDFTARDLQNDLKAKGLPWDIAKGFNGSAPVSEFFPLQDFPDLKNISFSLTKNGEKMQIGNSAQMIFDFENIIAYVSKFFTLKKGDLIFTGTPAGVGEIKIGDVLEGFLEEKKVLNCEVM